MEKNISIKSMVPNTAAIDTFTASDSTASRPNPSSMTDRPRTSDQGGPMTVLEANFNLFPVLSNRS